MADIKEIESAIEAALLQIDTFRITSYNVCYTKLLRPPSNCSRG